MGHHNRHFGNDTYAGSGVWGRPTSAANFCEEDYAVTSYIAEFINAFTNIAYVYLALRYPRRVRNGAPYYAQFDLMSISLIMVGIASFAYHASLRQTVQYGDDLSMFIFTGSLIYPLYAANQTPLRRHLIAAVLVIGIGFISVVYVRSGNILIHMTTFTVLLMLVWPRTLYLVYWQNRSREQIMHFMSTFKRAVLSFIVGFILWNIDLEMCFGLRELKEFVGVPLSWVLELHGWWHILTAIGASQYVRLTRELTIQEGKGAEKAHRS